jgi:hypothetical protein
MTLRNHHEMGNRIYDRIRRYGLSRFWFLLGNLAPDLYFSFIFRRHEYAASAGALKKAMRRLYDGRFRSRSILFSYALGIVSHYVCDYFCYSHSPSFEGGLWGHIFYEIRQRPEPEAPAFFPGFADMETDFPDMTDMLDERLACHNLTRSLNNGGGDDIGPAVETAARIGAIICLSAERTVYPDMFPAPVEIGAGSRI